MTNILLNIVFNKKCKKGVFILVEVIRLRIPDSGLHTVDVRYWTLFNSKLYCQIWAIILLKNH